MPYMQTWLGGGILNDFGLGDLPARLLAASSLSASAAERGNAAAHDDRSYVRLFLMSNYYFASDANESLAVEPLDHTKFADSCKLDVEMRDPHTMPLPNGRKFAALV